MYCSWEVVSHCNLACNHCYSTYHENGYRTKVKLTSSQLDMGLKNLSLAGMKQVNLEGGEPTLLGESLVGAIKSCNSYGMRAIISTHGMFLLKGNYISRLISAGLDTLSLSLDGSTPAINNAVRVTHSRKPSCQFECVIEFLQWFAVRRPPIKLKINTVVRKDNLTDLYELGNTLSRLLPSASPVQVKLVQVQPRGCGKESYPLLCVSKQEFEHLVSHVTKTSTFPVVYRGYDAGVYPFIVITCDGYAVIPNGEKHELIIDSCGSMNVFQSDFPVRINRFIKSWPSFLKKNDSINTYNLAVSLPNALGNSVS